MIYTSYVNNFIKLIFYNSTGRFVKHTMKYVRYLEETQNPASSQNLFSTTIYIYIYIYI